MRYTDRYDIYFYALHRKDSYIYCSLTNMSRSSSEENLHNSWQITYSRFHTHINTLSDMHWLTHCRSHSLLQSLICPELYYCAAMWNAWCSKNGKQCIWRGWRGKLPSIGFQLPRSWLSIVMWAWRQQPNVQGIGFGISDIWFYPFRSTMYTNRDTTSSRDTRSNGVLLYCICTVL